MSSDSHHQIPMELAFTLDGLGDVAQDDGRLAEAEELYLEAIELWHELGDRPNLAMTLRALAALQTCEKKWYAAGTLFGASETISGTELTALSPAERTELEPVAQAVYAELGEKVFASAHADGRTWPFDKLVTKVRLSVSAEHD